MSTSQMHLLTEIAEGHDGSQIPAAKRAYFQERLRGRFFDFLLGVFEEEEKKGLTEAKLARRTGKRPEVINRLFAAPSNPTLDTIGDLLLGMGGRELLMSSSSLLNRQPQNYKHLDDDITSTSSTQRTQTKPTELTTEVATTRNYVRM